MAKFFYYFGYGSNLLKERLTLMNPSAEFVSNGYVKGKKLSFNTYESQNWCGCVATIEDVPEEVTWGVVWKLDEKNIQTLDDQEQNYEPIKVNVTLTNGESHECRSYRCIKITNVSSPRPSPYYKNVIITGAIKSCLPEEYIEKLKKIEDNGHTGECKLYNSVMALIKD